MIAQDFFTSKPFHPPIFILGITQRSGTNFLYDLLRLHPDCAGFSPWEDLLVNYSDQLTRYAAAVAGHWEPYPEVNQPMLEEYLGFGLAAFLNRTASGKRVVTKTPSVNGIMNFFRLFPDSPLLIIVRDGRSVIQSGMTSFGWDFEQAARKWARGADAILAFKQSANSAYRIIKYENLFQNPVEEMEKILAFLNLDNKRYDFQACQALPVRGSSDSRETPQSASTLAPGAVSWDPVAKPNDFNPLNRWEKWTTAQHERFNWIAGKQMQALGYDLVRYAPSGRWQTKQRLLDFKTRVVRQLNRIGLSSARQYPGARNTRSLV